MLSIWMAKRTFSASTSTLAICGYFVNWQTKRFPFHLYVHRSSSTSSFWFLSYAISYNNISVWCIWTQKFRATWLIRRLLIFLRIRTLSLFFWSFLIFMFSNTLFSFFFLFTVQLRWRISPFQKQLFTTPAVHFIAKFESSAVQCITETILASLYVDPTLRVVKTLHWINIGEDWNLILFRSRMSKKVCSWFRLSLRFIVMRGLKGDKGLWKSLALVYLFFFSLYIVLILPNWYISFYVLSSLTGI